MIKQKTVLLLCSLAIASLAAFSLAKAETTVTVPVAFSVPKPPDCSFPCEEDLTLPDFARDLNLIGQQGQFSTNLTRKAFRLRLESWRKHAEVYRRSAEFALSRAEDWRAARLDHLLKIAYYEELLTGYRIAHAIDRAGNAEYGEVGE
ncbi:MAG: hypothetical protein AAGE89_08980 [Pseudomonadota bacterium]